MNAAEKRSSPTGMGFREFVAFVAACMALNALSIDIMLPALPQVGAAMGIDDNARQSVIAVYLLGFALAQLAFGPLSDRYGRKPVMLAGLGVYILASLISTLAMDFGTLLAARVLQGVGGAAPRVISNSLVRDAYSGADMGRVLSLAMMVFMATPIIAPSLGQLILLFAPWRWVFGVLCLGGILVTIWTVLRLRETLAPEHRRSIAPRAVFQAYREVITTPTSFGYTLAIGLVTGSLFGFVISSQQVFQTVFGLGKTFTLYFAIVALTLVPATFLNARLVHRIGLKRLSFYALLGFTAINLFHALITALGAEHLGLFLTLQCAAFFLFGFLSANFNALAMQPMGHIAGTAASFIGASASALAALLGFVIGQQFDGSVLPLTANSALLGVLAIMVVRRIDRAAAP